MAVEFRNGPSLRGTLVLCRTAQDYTETFNPVLERRKHGLQKRRAVRCVYLLDGLAGIDVDIDIDINSSSSSRSRQV